MAKDKKNKNEIPEENIPEEAVTGEVVEEPAENPLEAQLASEKERFLRLAAEYDNYRKRSAKERESIFADVKSDTITQFLPVYDNLSRALANETADEAYKKGVEMIMTQFEEVLKKMGVEEIPAVGKPFDPTRHNAVMHIDDEAYGENEVVEEFAKGFIMGEKVIRFSVVKVAN
ncbi:MAG: nucleotide exchange factor GrpE [Ruminococcaceae bacterium]|nr:nucleotide exchange factor GrpE [Oscillospiraceae bacterium]